MRVTTFNINSIRAREHSFPEWLARRRPDVLCLQELKCQEHDFPHQVFEDLGYHVVVFGQKTYNGVAVASRAPITHSARVFPLAGDEDARALFVETAGLGILNLYVVNGRAVGDEKYVHKLAWLDGVLAWLRAQVSPTDPLVLCGDYNIAPTDLDVHDPKKWQESVLCSAPERERFQALLHWGLTDAWRHKYPDASGRYTHTWWDYRGRAFQIGLGLRIDHHLVTESVLARLEDVEIDRDARKGERASDHAPVTLVLSD